MSLPFALKPSSLGFAGRIFPFILLRQLFKGNLCKSRTRLLEITFETVFPLMSIKTVFPLMSEKLYLL